MADADRRARKSALRRLRAAFTQRRLTLFTGAGLSMGSGLPSWRTLVASLFINAARDGHADFTMDLLDAVVAEWLFEHSDAPLEILGRKIRVSYGIQTPGLLVALRELLYSGTHLAWYGYKPLAAIRRDVLRINPTLEAVVALCRQSTRRRGLRRVVTYNYDNLLELTLPPRTRQPIWRPAEPSASALPIYHVHGYIPVTANEAGSAFDDIVLTEDQYNRVANDPYSWTNLVQLQAMTDSVGLIIGMSLNDRNLRRLLDATSRAAQRPELYALVERPRAPALTDEDVSSIARLASERYVQMQSRPEADRPTTDPAVIATPGLVRGLLDNHAQADVHRLTTILDDLSIHPLWYDDVAEIAPFVTRIAG